MSRNGWIIMGVVVAVAAFFGWRYTHRAPADAVYKTAQLVRGDLSEVITANGTLNPVRVVSVGTQVSGTVSKLYVDFNDKVAAGQLLLELDPSVYAAKLAASEASLANIRSSQALAEANAARSAELFRQNFISRQDYDTAQQQMHSSAALITQAEAQIRQDRTNLGYTVIRSPVSGVVISRQIDVGQTVAASFSTPTLFTIARDLTKMQIETAVAEADVARVKMGQSVDFTVDAYGTRNFSGIVQQIRLNPTTQQNVVTYTVIVAVANPDGALLPGMTANASFRIAQHDNVLLIPNAALSYKPADWTPQRRADKPDSAKAATADAAKAATAGSANVSPAKTGKRAYDPNKVTVFTLRDGAASPVRIKIGASDADNSEVVDGSLKEGDEVIVGDATPVKKASGGFMSGPPSGHK
jgi:HlyD family secretion protein